MLGKPYIGDDRRGGTTRRGGRRRMRSVGGVLVALGLAMVALGCSSDSKTSTSSASSASTASGSVAPEDVRASAAAVASGLKAIQATAKAMIAAGTDKTKLASEDANIEPAWAKIEGTGK